MPDPTPSARELQILRILWQHGRASVREVADALHAGDTRLAYTTVLTVLQTMRRKGLVRHEREGKAHIFIPCVEEAATLRSLAGGFLQRVFDGAVDQYLVRALETTHLTDEELDRIQKLITDAKKRTRRSGKKGESR